MSDPSKPARPPHKIIPFTQEDTRNPEWLVQEWCLHCGRQLDFQENQYYVSMGAHICSRCADVVANQYSYWHGARYLTWDNPPSPRNNYGKRDIPEGLRWKVFERDGYKCRHCGSGMYLRADHVVPESAGGAATMDNLQTLCRTCNSKKGTNT